MKKIYLTLSLLLSTYAISQVGINTDDPKATLDVNGNVRIQKSDEVSSTTHVLTADSEGFVHQISVEQLGNLGVVNMESATFIPGISDISSRLPVLDLWKQQRNDGVETIKRYYFLGQNVSVTLPENISKPNDGTARVITFVAVKNDEFGGNNLNGWNIAFQTKLYQENQNDFEGTNGGVQIYENTFAGSDLKSSSALGLITENNNPYRRRISLNGQDNIADREINFYDFGGKWIMTVND